MGRVQNLSLAIRGQQSRDSPTPIIIEVDPDSGSGSVEYDEPIKQVIRPTVKSMSDEIPRELGNPVTSYVPNRPRGVFLQHLDISNAVWDCSCDIGVG